MTPEEINRRIATWLGLKCTCKGAYWGACEMHSNGGVATDYYRTNAAMDLLVVLVERGYTYTLQDNIHGAGHGLFIWRRDDTLNELADSSYQPTIPAAICTAILELIEREGR